jgi:hypothetical protein
MKKSGLWIGVLASLFLAAAAHATSITYAISMTGAQEVPGPGDPDGSAVGTLTVDDVTGVISWSFTYANLDSLTGMHIHAAPAGSSAGVFVGLALTGSAGSLVGSVTTTPANALAINTNPSNYYVNLHTSVYPSGAVRDQLGTLVPEPGVAALLAASLAAARWGRRRASVS